MLQNIRSLRKTLFIIIPILICIISFVVFAMFSDSSPSLYYEGKHLSKWLLLYQSPSSPHERDQAKQAIRQIGPNALPFMEKLVRDAHFDSFRVIKNKWIFRQDGPVHDIRRMVFNGYDALGDIAKPSVPFLLEMLKDSNPIIRSTAAGALGWIGFSEKKVADGLIVALHDEIIYVRRDAALALGQLFAGTNNARIIDELKKLLKDKSTIVQDAAKRTIESLQKQTPSDDK
jgi:hypothetical protein